MPGSKENLSDESSPSAETEPNGSKEQQVTDIVANVPEESLQDGARALVKTLKRKSDDDDGAEIPINGQEAKENEDDKPGKRSSLGRSTVALEPRLKWQTCILHDPEGMMKLLRSGDLQRYACGLNDCTSATRDKERGLMDETKLRQVEKEFYLMYTNRDRYDKFLCFPKTMTHDILTDLIKKELITSENCFLCEKPFEGWQHYEWKLCGKHIMHLHCPGKISENALQAVYGRCSCAKEAKNKRRRLAKATST